MKRFVRPSNAINKAELFITPVASCKPHEMVPYMLLWLLVIALAALLVAWYLLYLKFYWYLKSVPTIRQLPLVGGALEFSSTAVLYTRLLELRKELGNNFWTMLGVDPTLVTADPNLLKVILSSNKLLEKSRAYKYAHPWLGQGLLTSSGDRWRIHRKVITPAFHFKILEEQTDVFNTSSDVLVKVLKQEVGNPDVDIYPYVTLCTLDIICETAMGISVEAQQRSNNDYVNKIKAMGRILVERAIRPIEQFDATYFFTKNYWVERKSLKYLHKFTNSVIGERRKLVKSLGTETSDEFGVKKRLAFLDLLLNYTAQGATQFTDVDIREEVDTFMFEGHDTSSSGVSFTLYLLANHPEEQEKVFEEIRSIFADDKDRPATYKDLQDMKYLELVLKESMRLYPPVPLISRELTEDVPYDGVVLPKGLTVMVAIHMLHRDPDIYPEPDLFKPERFSSDQYKGESRNAYDYVPFSAGPRNCIGQKFAMFSMKSTISKVLRHYELLPVQYKMVPLLESILKSNNGVRMRLKERKW